MIVLLVFFLTFLVGLLGIILSKNVIKTIVSLSIMETAAILIFISLSNYKEYSLPFWGLSSNPIDPFPQALMITTIVIGSAVTALSLMISIKIFHYYGSLDWSVIFKKDGE
jgi:multicomponent Na+:H+ antiporter subunit C